MPAITPIPIYRDNYVWMIVQGSRCWLVDPGDGAPVIDYLRNHNLALEGVFITHKHWDHVDGLRALVAEFPAPVYGPGPDLVTGVSHTVSDGDRLAMGDLDLLVIAIPGHTFEHLAYYAPSAGALFSGDTLFSAGCGRVFDGTIEDLFESLERIKSLPADTQIFAAHEYTLANLAFAATVEPDNEARDRYQQECLELRQRQLPTLPASLATERAINPFLRTDSKQIKQRVEAYFQTRCYSERELFRLLRRWKDTF